MTVDQAVEVLRGKSKAVVTANGERVYLVMVGVGHHKLGNTGKISFYKNELASLYIERAMRPQELVALSTLTAAS